MGLFCASNAWGRSDVSLKIDGILDTKTVTASGRMGGVQKDQVLAVKSQNIDVGLIGYVRVTSVEKTRIKGELVRTSQYHLIRVGDALVSFDLSSESEDYNGSTELLIRDYAPSTSARFKPLFTQGFVIGDTAQTLWKKEYLITASSFVHYGITNWLSVGTWLLADVTTSPNLILKARFIDRPTVSAATGLTVARDPKNSNRWTLNWNLMWDFFSTEETVSHTFASLAIYNIEKAEDTTAIKSAGTSSFQTGYEFIFDNWNRLLLGPNYNFETKTVGGYFSYVKIWDRFHLQGTLYSTNIRTPKWSTEDGYFVYVDGYWRF